MGALSNNHKTSPGDVFNAKNGRVNDGRMTQQNSFDVQSADLVTSRSEKSKLTYNLDHILSDSKNIFEHNPLADNTMEIRFS